MGYISFGAETKFYFSHKDTMMSEETQNFKPKTDRHYFKLSLENELQVFLCKITPCRISLKWLTYKQGRHTRPLATAISSDRVVFCLIFCFLFPGQLVLIHKSHFLYCVRLLILCISETMSIGCNSIRRAIIYFLNNQ